MKRTLEAGVSGPVGRRRRGPASMASPGSTPKCDSPSRERSVEMAERVSSRESPRSTMGRSESRSATQLRPRIVES